MSAYHLTSMNSASPVKQYGLALLLPLLLLMLRLQVMPMMEGRNPYLLFYPGVFAVAWYGGLGPGLVSTLWSGGLAACFFIAPVGSLLPTTLPDTIGLGVFAGMGALISWMAEVAHAARRRMEQLAERLKENEAELRAHAEELSAANRRKDEFLAILAHELRNPLAAVSNAAAVLQSLPPASPAGQRAVEVIRRQVQHQARMVDDLLDVARLVRGTTSLRRESLDLEELVGKTVEEYRERAEAAGLTLQYQHGGASVPVAADPVRIAQALGNVLDNALKFTPAGGTITVRLDADSEAGRASVSVADTGVGLPPELLERIFEPLVQAEQTLDRAGGGLGLGLSLVKGLVELNGGEVHATSGGPGQGTTFTLTLPLEGGRTPAEPEAGIQTRRQPRRILLIEDNRDAAETLRDLLELEDHEVRLAEDGPSGIEAALAFRPEVVVCDLGLPGMDGFQVGAKLQRQREGGEFLLIALTGYGDEETRRRTEEAGFHMHFTKPVEPEALLRAVSAPLPAASGERESSSGVPGTAAAPCSN